MSKSNAPTGSGTNMPTGNGVTASPYSGQNPYSTGMFNRAADSVQGRMGNSMAQQGLSNSGVQQMYGRQINDLATGIYGQAYDQDMGRQVAMREGDLNRQQSALFGLPGMVSGITQFGLGLGDVGRNDQQQRINSAIQQWNAAENHPLQGLDIMSQLLSMASGMGGGIQVNQSNPGQFTPTSTAGMLSGWDPV